MVGAGSPTVDGDSVLAFDVGGTDIKAALSGPDGALHSLQRVPTPRARAGTGEAIVKRVAELTHGLVRDYPAASVKAMGFVVPGLVDERGGVGILAANLGWSNYPFGRRLREETGLPVAFGHDVGAAGEAEMRLGAGQGLRNAVVLVIGTGIAGAIFCDGARVAGDGFAGEIGHTPVPGGFACACGAHGCLETISSAGAIVRRYNERTGRKAVGADEVVRAARSGDVRAGEVWDAAVDGLAAGICQLAALLGTEAVILGGGLSQAGEFLTAPLTRAVDARLSFHRRPGIRISMLGQDAGLIGAALHARGLTAVPL
ncbi:MULTISPECIES: ROK family protein [unclassified Arthrobacter]|uniref:ROK family protein n=1 Tax=unclassified Arthrobacter TaxID=235627 RepID=UPI001D15046A|nr:MULTISPECIES: ROK family protein [unclassified Arthrobacter]MCC3291673.1 ROK family protein [Arthrobacter sp. zg-Y1110]MCC3302049.1 ROK family protein [Arthrobacter sp. zg-Y895]UWX85516.1 ROK family protein [Arthrobacter sp. zg-Y1110]